MKTEISTEIEIDAPAEVVWAELAETAAYPDWNPFIRSFEGELVQGGRVSVRIEPPGGRGMNFRPKLLAVKPGRELRWLGHVLVPGLFDGEHRFMIEPLADDRSRLTQSEAFSGLLVRAFAGTLSAAEEGFQQMNEALRLRAEARAAAAQPAVANL